MEQLREHLAEIHDLGRAAALLSWDERTMMPASGAESRADQLATLAAVRHRMFAADEVGRMIDAARPEVEGLDPDSEPASLIRVVGRDWEKARRVPAELRAELARAAALGEAACAPSSSTTSSGRAASRPTTTASRASRIPTTRCSTSTSPGPRPSRRAPCSGICATGSRP